MGIICILISRVTPAAIAGCGMTFAIAQENDNFSGVTTYFSENFDSLAGALMRRTCTSWTPWGSRRQNMLGTLHLYCDNLTCASSLTSSTRGRRQLLETLGAKEMTHAWVVFLFCDSSRCAKTFASLTGACSLISCQRKITNMQGDRALPKETLLLYSSSKHLKGHLSVHVSTLFVSEVFSGNLLPLFGPSVHKYMEDASTIGHLKI